jgi:fibronectin type 3 domain-containing protein
MSPNKLIVSWKGEENAKKDIRMAGSFLRNQSMELFWSFKVKTSQKTYLISVKNYNVVL